MARKIKISKKQYEQALSEGITLTADVDACNGDVKQAVDNAKQNAKKNGVNLSDATISVPADTNEGRIITKKELQENRLKVLKANSKLFSVKDFVNKIK